MSLFFASVSYSFHKRILTFFGSVFLLPAIFCAAFSPVIFADQPTLSEAVYCPLTHQFQPIKANNTDAFVSLGEICASDALKDKFSDQLLSELTTKSLELGSAEVSKLAFDFWHNGKSAFDSAPNKTDPNDQTDDEKLFLSQSVPAAATKAASFSNSRKNSFSKPSRVRRQLKFPPPLTFNIHRL